MEEMASLNSILCRHKEATLPSVQLEEPDEIQAKVLSAFAYQIKDGSVLQLEN